MGSRTSLEAGGLTRKHRSLQLSRVHTGILMAIPASLFTFALLVYPILNVFWSSLYELNLAEPANTAFRGLGNFVDILFRDPNFWLVVRNTVFFTAIVVGAELAIGFLLALVLNQTFPGRGFFRTAFMTPWVIPPVVVALVWAWILNDTYGILNYLLMRIGIITQPVLWLGDVRTAMWSVIAIDIWRETPFFTLVLLAGLQAIPTDLYEASAIDGASRVQKVWFVTLPLLKPSILVSLLVRTMSAFKIFDLIYVLTHGGPAGQTEVLATYIYKTAFTYMDIGRGSALAVIMLVIVLVLSYCYIRLLGEKQD